MRFRNLIFDLDGTLADSLPAIEASTRYAVAKCLPERIVPPMRKLIGPPIATMLARLWPDLSAEQLAELVIEFRRHYDADGCLHSKLYPGVLETLTALSRQSINLYVLTNKPLLPSRRILEHNAVLSLFKDVVSPDSVNPAFASKIEAAVSLAARHSLDPAVTLLMGDGLDDSKAAAHCGFSFVAAAYGYGNAAADENTSALAIVSALPDLARVVLQ